MDRSIVGEDVVPLERALLTLPVPSSLSSVLSSEVGNAVPKLWSAREGGDDGDSVDHA